MVINTFLHYISTFHLEVLGAGGAVWGFSEMVGLRHDDNWFLWRYISSLVTLIFLIRWLIIFKLDMMKVTHIEL